MTSGGLRKPERLRRRVEFERVYSLGRRVHGKFMTVFCLNTGESRVRLGVAASKKMGNAVERNKAKRIARALYRLEKPSVGTEVVIVPKRPMLKARFTLLEAEFQRSLTRNGSAIPPVKSRSPERA